MADVPKVSRELVERIKGELAKQRVRPDGSPLEDIAALCALAEMVLDANERGSMFCRGLLNLDAGTDDGGQP